MEKIQITVETEPAILPLVYMTVKTKIILDLESDVPLHRKDRADLEKFLKKEAERIILKLMKAKGDYCAYD